MIVLRVPLIGVKEYLVFTKLQDEFYGIHIRIKLNWEYVRSMLVFPDLYSW